MQLILAIVNNRDVGRLTKALNENGFRTTKVASTGGFLKSYNTTLIIGCQEEHVEEALEIIKENTSARRRKELSDVAKRDKKNLFNARNIEIGGAIVFVLQVDQFYQF